MIFDHISIGGGVIGFNTTERIISKIIRNNNLENRYFNFAIIDKEIKNIEGGTAYNPNLSKYGYFNNPNRLSPKSFIDYVKSKKFKKELKYYLDKQTGYVNRNWKNKYIDILSNKKNHDFDELYLPRASFGLWQKNRILQLLSDVKIFNNNNKNNTKINLYFYEGEVNQILEEKKILKLFFKNNYSEYQIKKNIEDLNLKF